MNLAPVTQSGTRKKKKRGAGKKRIGFAREEVLNQMGEDDGNSDNKPDEEGKVTSSSGLPSSGPPSSGPPSSGPPNNGNSNGGSMLAGLNIRSKKSIVASSTTTSTSISGNNQDVTAAEQMIQDDLAKAMAESMQESPFDEERGVDLSAMDSLPKSTLASEEPTSSSSSSAAAATTTKVPSSGISAARRPSYTATGRSSRASTLENMSTSDGADAQKSTSERLSSEINAFGSTVERFQNQVIHFSKRKVALSEQKVLLEENTSALLQELAMAETAQNHAIESEDYEEAETFNSTIADVQNRQSRNASELR
jgi:hypothetical protein